ncbi:MAG: 30S ribosomal protein S12 methylthiotransferase RimO [Muribaculaceae bacterium]|nr:30S ribosomal protein S12 methylthiotransferase RimO [Muribaculaceae bacterium]
MTAGEGGRVNRQYEQPDCATYFHSKVQTINVITLGCSKNLVDSERVLKMLRNAGFQAQHESGTVSDIVVINTCGFIGDAKEESVNTILEFAEAKKRGDIKELYVMGCLSERYADDLKAEIPEVDKYYGKFDWERLVDDLTRRHNDKGSYDRVITTPSHFTYLKIAEGCNRFCAFCAIPLITGRYKSRPIAEIEQEVRTLVSRGVKEFNVIAQDLSGYGQDLNGGELMLPELIERLAAIPGVKWLRLHYAYPAQFPYPILDVMARHENVCSYLDIALQHISDNMLSRMRRHISGAQTRELLSEMRRRVPGLHIRTTLMVGFPGETEEDFQELLEFVKEQRFERMGAFAYCEEEGTFAAEHYADDVPEDVKQRRLDQLMAVQEQISLDIQEEKVGKVLEVVIDREEEDYYVGRTEWDSPEVDPEVLVEKSRALAPGEFVRVKINQALPFELIAEPV